MRGYLTRSGLGLMGGLAVLALCAASVLTLSGTTSARATSTLDGALACGPFLIDLERCALRPGPDGRTRALIQMHLWRPEGPVPVSRRVSINGRAAMDGAWRLERADWLIRNEFTRVPTGDVYVHPLLGAIPATSHPGEARAVFQFDWVCPRSRPDRTPSFTFRLPRGGAVRFDSLRMDSR